jgi:hypothetical protein
MNSARVKHLVGVAAVLAALLGASTAFAHYLRGETYVWENSDGKCLKDRVEISDGRDQGGFTKVNAYPQRRQTFPDPFPDADCATGWKRELKVRTKLLKKSSSGSWYVCRTTSWTYANATELEQRRYWNAPCGDGDYRGRGEVYLRYNGKWRGGGYTHGESHYLRR